MRDVRHAALAAVLLAGGVAVLAEVLDRIYAPTVADPNYWVGHTGGLVPLLLAVVAAGLAGAAGLTLLIGLALRGSPVAIAPLGLLGIAALLGGILWLPLVWMLVPGVPGAPTVSNAFPVLPPVLVAIGGGVGILAAYGPGVGDARRRAAALLAAGAVLDVAAAGLGWWTRMRPVRTGALGYPVEVVDGVGVVTWLAGSLLLAGSALRRDVVPSWIGGVLLAAVAFAVVVPLVRMLGITPGWLRPTAGFGVAWLAVGVQLWRLRRIG